MSILKGLYKDCDLEYVYSPEGVALSGETERSVYILLTDTKTRFSKISRLITKDPYNHVSLMLSDSFDEPIYTFTLSSFTNGIRGGFQIENKEHLRGANYSLYRVGVTEDIFTKISDKVVGYANDPQSTSYNHLGLFNALFRKDIFSNKDSQAGICSEFIVEVLKFSGINLFNFRSSSTIRPYDLVKSKLLKFVKRGKIV